MTTKRTSLAAVAIGTALAASMAAQNPDPNQDPNRRRGPTFAADYRFAGSNLTGFTTIGNARWRAENGVIIGTPTQPGGGWLVLDKSYQDLKLYAHVLCAAGCQTGVMVRAEKATDGTLNGAFMSLASGAIGPQRVAISASGEARREPFPAPPAGRGGGGGGGGRGGANNTPPPGFPPGTLMVAGSPLPPLSAELVARFPEMASRPVGVWRDGQWNELELLVTANNMSPKFNGAVVPGNAAVTFTGEDADRFGQIALYVGGTGEVRFEDLRTEDLLKREVPAEQVSNNFRMQQLDAIYYSWSAAAADFNGDRVMDVAAGPFVYLGPAFTEARQVYLPEAANPIGSYPLNSMINLASDFTGDGAPDLLVVNGNSAGGNATGSLYVNPRGESRLWRKYDVIQPIGNEDTLLDDIDGDGRPEVIHAGENKLRYSKPDPANPTGTWITKTVSEPGMWGAGVSHGLGVGDINGDGRKDYVTSWGWWEQPASLNTDALWTHHPAAFGRFGASQGGPLGGSGGADLAVYDVNGDGRNDVVATLEGHGFGMAWFEQKRNGSAITFTRHMIMDNFLTSNAGGVIFTQPHGGMAADIDGDRIPDYVTGKRYMSHFAYADPDSFSPPVLYVYRTVRNPRAPGGAEFVPELIHNRSGIGSRIAIADMNGDGSNDIVTSANFGTFVFLNNRRPR